MGAIKAMERTLKDADGPMTCAARRLALLVLLVIGFGAHAQPDSSTQPDAQPPSDPYAVAVQRGVATLPLFSNRDWLNSFYAERGFAPAWFVDGQPTSAARGAAVRLAAAAAEGLDPANYPLPQAVLAGGSRLGADETARADVALTDVVFRYAVHLSDGQYVPGQADRQWDIKKQRLDPAAWLQAALAGGDLERAFDALAPEHPVYGDLRRALSDHVALQSRGGWPAFPAQGPRKLEPDDRHPQIIALRDRLKVTDGPIEDTVDPEFYDAGLVEAVKRFQRRHGLNEDGVVGFGTRAALAAPVEDRIEQLRIAMERVRWMPRDLGSTHVLVNVPAYRLWFVKDGATALTMRTIVGQYKRQTPTFSASISYLVLNPKWYVPNRIAVEDLVPKAQEDPEYYQRAGFKVYSKETGEPVDPAEVDWSAYGKCREMPFRLVQNSGNNNALGNIKFMFQNPYGVYLHDTSKPSLFVKDRRAFSSGCIRVEQPLELASGILSEFEPVASAEVEGLIARAPTNRHLNLERQVELHVTYITAWADETGAYFYEDIYKRDRMLRQGGLQPR